MPWKHEEKTCQLVEFAVPLDTNLANAYHQKRSQVCTTHLRTSENVP